jgi:hypothetical protein
MVVSFDTHNELRLAVDALSGNRPSSVPIPDPGEKCLTRRGRLPARGTKTCRFVLESEESALIAIIATGEEHPA